MSIFCGMQALPPGVVKHGFAQTLGAVDLSGSDSGLELEGKRNSLRPAL